MYTGTVHNATHTFRLITEYEKKMKEKRKYDEIKEKYEKIKINDFISHRPLINALFGGTVLGLIMPSMWRFPFIHIR